MQARSEEVYGYMTPPPSPHKRRHLLRQSEEIDEEMTLDAFLYRSDDFRKSSFEHPWPLPLQLNKPKPAWRLFGPLFQHLVPKIRLVLQEHSIRRDQSWADTYMASKPGFPGGHIPILTLVILVDQGIHNSPTWGEAKDGIRELFAEDHFPNIEVEIYDPKRSFVPTIFPLQPDVEAIARYQEKRDRLLECLEENLPNYWNAMSVFGFGSTKAASKPALVVFVRPHAIQNWNRLARRLGAIFDNYQYEIEFIFGGVSTTPAMSFANHPSFGTPGMGSSIGMIGEEGGGTLGGFVSLERGGKTKTGVITNHHVVRPNINAQSKDLKVQSQAAIDLINQFGYGSVNTSSITGTIQYPAMMDLEATRKDLVSNELPAAANSIKDTKNKISRFRLKDQEVPERLTRMLDFQQGVLDKNTKRVATLEQLPLVIGNVLLSSGDAVPSARSILDWAIIGIPASKVPQPQPNILPSTEEVARAGKSPREYGLDNVHSYQRLDGHYYAQGFTEIEKGAWYFKIGRTTGITTGVCHGVEVDVGRKGQIRYDHNGLKVVLGKKSTRELVIMSSTQSFSAPGDPGSFVLNNAGEVAGLLYGELTGNITSGETDSEMDPGLEGESHLFTENTVIQGTRVHTGSGLVTSMGEVLESIREHSGIELSLNLTPSSKLTSVQPKTTG